MNRDIFFELDSASTTRGHNLKLIKPRNNLNIRKFSFSHRVIDDWNKLPGDVVNSLSLNEFKNRLDKYFESQGKI